MLQSQPQMRSGFFGRIAYPLAVENRTMHEETDGKKSTMFSNIVFGLTGNSSGQNKYIKLEQSATISIYTFLFFSRFFVIRRQLIYKTSYFVISGVTTYVLCRAIFIKGAQA
jgi:hypothetical protein